ncbi:acyl carrier protein [Dactylosporangium sp. NBC_01737]|uniref:phosphopantetheine-binding protein n=1 Tax=Dactylosporangium sp. NBC_01737 TaxID=2975959 RepID=UPI002E130A62|nr:acyl carrier protein [Dactylosporangium sp. NBC_01737]
MNGLDDFVAILRDDIGLPVQRDEIALSFDNVPGWDSVHLLTLLTILERTTGRRISFAAVLEAGSLHDIYELAAAP